VYLLLKNVEKEAPEMAQKPPQNTWESSWHLNSLRPKWNRVHWHYLSVSCRPLALWLSKKEFWTNTPGRACLVLPAAGELSWRY